MKQKTALAQAIEQIEKHCDNYVLHKKDIIDILLSLKPIERQQIEDFGYNFFLSETDDAKDFFNETLTQD